MALMSRSSFKIFWISLLTFTSMLGFSQSASLSDSLYRERVSEYDYSDEKREKSESKVEPKKEVNKNAPADYSFLKSTLSVIIMVLILVIITAIIIYQVQRTNYKKKVTELKAASSIEHAEQELLDVSLDELIEEATVKKDLRMQVHLQFLELLRSLHHNGHIRWEPYKTNGQYYHEISKKSVRTTYAEVTRLFDRVWYGHKTIDQSGFEAWMIQLNKIKS